MSFVLEKNALNSPVQQGQKATFSLNVTNNGTENLYNFSLGDNYNTTFLNYSSASPSPDYVNYSVGMIKWIFYLNASDHFDVVVNFSTLATGNTTNVALVFNETNDSYIPLKSENDKAEITSGFTPISVNLISPPNERNSLNVSSFNFTYTVNMQANCSRYWNESGNWSNQGHSVITSGSSYLTESDVSDETYIWNVRCFEQGNDTNFAWGNATNWTFTVNVTEEFVPISVNLTYPTDGITLNSTSFNFTYTVNMQANCSRYWNESGNWSNQGHSVITSGSSYLTESDVSDETYIWNVRCFEQENDTNFAWGNATNWTFSIDSPTFMLFKNSSSYFYEIGETVDYSINITNPMNVNLTSIWLNDTFDFDLNFTNQSNCEVYNYSNDDHFVEINVTQCLENLDNGVLEPNESFVLYMNFTAVSGAENVSNMVYANATDHLANNYDQESDMMIGIGDGPHENWNDGLNQWESSIVSPYVVRGQEKTLNFTLYRNAGDDSCLRNITISIPINYTFEGYNYSSNENCTFYDFTNYVVWNATNDDFFCGEGPEYFAINVSSIDPFGSKDFSVTAEADDNTSSGANFTVFTTTTFWYNGTVYDKNGQPITSAVASLAVLSFSMGGDIDLGIFPASTDSNGTFNITEVPGLNASLDEGPGGPGGDMGGLFYRLSAVKYNDSENHLGMYVGPNLPELPESELRSHVGLADPDLYLKPAVTFHLQVEGYDYKEGPTNESLCNESGCPDEAFDWTNIGYSYSLKDSRYGYSVTSTWSNVEESYITAPLSRNYSLMVYPSSSFPIYIDFTSIDDNCNSTGVNISSTGVNATCIETNGTRLIDITIESDMNITPFTGYVDETGLDDLWIMPYMLGSGNMIFDQDTLPFNMGNMMRWPPNSTFDDHYNLSSGEYSVYLPATQAHSDIIMMAFARKNETYYLDYHKISSEGKNFVNGSCYNFSLNQLIAGPQYSISSYNVSGDWNETDVVNTTSVQFNLVDENDTLLETESAFIEMKMEIEGEDYMRMTNSNEGVFYFPLLSGTGIDKLTVYSQQYSPLSMPVSAAILGGTPSTKINCSDGVCNVSLSQFKTVDPETGQDMGGVNIHLIKSKEGCNVPFPPQSCMLDQMGKEGFSPLKAILSGDITFVIKKNNIEIKYVNADLLASGPPDASFTENATETGLEAAWKFGSQGPEIYDEIIIGMPIEESIADLNVTVKIDLLYDNDFNVIWNSSVNTTDQLNDTDYADYLIGDYLAYLNGTGVLCNESDMNLTHGLCYKNTTLAEPLIFMRIPHFTGVGVEVAGGGALPANLTIWDSTDPEGGSQTKYPAQTVYFYANYSNEGSPVNGSGAYCNVSYNKTGGWSTESMSYNASSELYGSTETFSSYGSIYWNVTCSSDNYTSMAGNDTVAITQAPEVSITVQSPQNTTYSSVPIDINITTNGSSEWCGWDLNNTGNTTLSGSGTTWYDTIDSSTQGIQQLYVYCNSSEGGTGSNTSVYFTYDSMPPVASGQATSPASGSGYSYSQSYQFNMSWSDSISAVSHVWIQENMTGSLGNHSATNSSGSEYYYDTGSLAASNFYYMWCANDTQGSENCTSGYNYIVNKAVLAGSLFGSGVTYTNPVNVTASESNSGDSDVNYTLWRNGTLVSSALGSAPGSDSSQLAVGTYHYVLNSTGGVNYTSNSSIDTLDVTVSKTSSTCTMTSSSGWSFTYETYTTMICSCTGDGTMHLYFNGSQQDSFNGTSKLFGADASGCSVVCNITDGINYSSASDSGTLNITKKNAGVSVYPQTQAITYGSSVLQYCTDNSNLLNCTLYRNETPVTNGTQATLASDIYELKANISDTANYTGYENISTLTVNKVTTSITLLLNGSTWSSNSALEYPNPTNVTATINVATLTPSLMINGTITPDSPYNVTSLVLGTYNYTGNFSGNQNYTASSVTRVLIMRDTTDPSVTLNKPQTNTTHTNGTVEINWTIIDQLPDQQWYIKDSSSTKNPLLGLVNNTTASFGTGQHEIYLYSNDTTGNTGLDYVVFFVNTPLNVTKELDEMTTAVGAEKLRNVTLKDSTGNETSNETENANQTFSLEMEVNETATNFTVEIVEFNGLEVNWDEDFDLDVDNSSQEANNSGSSAGTSIKKIVLFKNMTKFIGTDKYTKGARIFIDYPLGEYDVLYIDDDNGNTVYKLRRCANNTPINCTSVATACFTNTTSNVTLYVPHLSGGALADDTVGPTINMTSPENGSTVDNSYFTFTFEAKEANPKQNFCWYNLTNSTNSIEESSLANTSFSWSGTVGTYTTVITAVDDGSYNMTINCTDLKNQSTQETFSFSVSDSSSPSITISSPENTTYSSVPVDLGVALDETGSLCMWNLNNTSNDTLSGSGASWSDSITCPEGTHRLYVYCNDSAGNMGSNTSVHFTYQLTTTTTTTTLGGSSGGGGGSSSTEHTKSQTWAVVKSKVMQTMSITDEEVGFSQIRFSLKNQVSNLKITARRLSSRPSTVDEPAGHVYRYMEIITENMENDNVDSARIIFKVSKEWVSENGIEKDTVALNRYNDGWKSLRTWLVNQDSDYYTYEADSPGFSVFSITGNVLAGTGPGAGDGPDGAGGEDMEPGEGKIPTSVGGEIPPETQIQLVVSLLIFAILVGAVAYWKRDEIFNLKHKEKKYSYVQPSSKSLERFKKKN